MQTKSTYANRHVVHGASRSTSRRAEFLDTLRGQMDDVARGERIKALREARRLTQPAVVERMCEVGGPKPDGRPHISLRGYQRYEEGGGIPWDKTRVLAQVLDTTEDFILRGEGERRQPRPARSIDTDLAERLANIEERLDAAEPVAVDRLDGELEDRITRIEGTLQEVRRGLENLHVQREGFLQLLAAQQEVLEGIAGVVGPEALRDLAAKALEPSIEQARAGLADWARELQGSAQDPSAGGGTRRTRGSREA